MAQVTELDFGPGPFNTQVELSSRWQVLPETVFASHDDPLDIELKWPSNSELGIRYAAGYPSDPSSLWCKSRFLDEKDFVIHSDRS